jgi:hypothetical protein
MHGQSQLLRVTPVLHVKLWRGKWWKIRRIRTLSGREITGKFLTGIGTSSLDSKMESDNKDQNYFLHFFSLQQSARFATQVKNIGPITKLERLEHNTIQSRYKTNHITSIGSQYRFRVSKTIPPNTF